ncbi:hypothetical protein A3F34_02155 [Candidatus Roizmanbacteria bacterium RIFCSPHIGHO2_12_FULL_44_10]|uniref:Uncharacterized protein n=1 Tax=Candidatus Roizmanbacteria bacterium RIFCSPHIGHO2_12_FULL_44_10 TaxID=1802054 RepID=A0A1F7I6J1_9BACT|nr:MAG: hypothetical protein A3F34_02155 [Candidatus Roizmanbacteria bacterium RIFCSPHIGHO2_12_FULL_44_10]
MISEGGIGYVSRHLEGLPRRGQLAAYAFENRDELTATVFGGFNQLVDDFNTTDWSDLEGEVLHIMKGYQHLKNILGEVPLPRPSSLSDRELLLGTREATRLMRLSHQSLTGGGLPDGVNAPDTISTPLFPTSDHALVVGIASHIIERALFTRLRKIAKDIADPDHVWRKDDILHALQDMVLLRHTRSIDGIDDESALFEVITAPHSKGGLGWRREDQVDNFTGTYNSRIDIIG